jgi:hypothetical protein
MFRVNVGLSLRLPSKAKGDQKYVKYVDRSVLFGIDQLTFSDHYCGCNIKQNGLVHKLLTLCFSHSGGGDGGRIDRSKPDSSCSVCGPQGLSGRSLFLGRFWPPILGRPYECGCSASPGVGWPRESYIRIQSPVYGDYFLSREKCTC